MRVQHWLYKLPLRLRSLFLRRNVEHELEAELQFHLDRQIDQYIANGMDASEARYAALREMGGLDQHKEAVRDVRGMNLVDNFLQDLRYAFRTLRRSRGLKLILKHGGAPPRTFTPRSYS